MQGMTYKNPILNFCAINQLQKQYKMMKKVKLDAKVIKHSFSSLRQFCAEEDSASFDWMLHNKA